MISCLAAILFWLCAFIVLHTYVLFPWIIRRIARNRRSAAFEASNTRSTQNPRPFEPVAISIVIAAYNEEAHIVERIENIAAQDYPSEHLRVLVGSDGSSDATAERLHELSSNYPWLEPIIFSSNRGKAAVVNDLVARCTTDLIVFSDADVVFESGALKAIVTECQRPNIGAVAGTRVSATRNPNGSLMHDEEQAYLGFDNRIRAAEGEVGCLIGAHGCFFAMRRELFRPLPDGIALTDDFYYSMLPFEQGYGVGSAPDAIVYSEASKTTDDDFQRKLRYSATGFATLMRFKGLLADPKRPLLSYCFWSHRVSKWLIPIVLLIWFVVNALCLPLGIGYQLFFALQLLFLFICLLVYIQRRLLPNVTVPRLLNFSYYFVSSNAALLLGLIRYLQGKNTTRWQTQR